MHTGNAVEYYVKKRENKMAVQSNPRDSASRKYWGIWLPIPTIIAIINSLFWTSLIFQAVGNNEQTIEKSVERIIQQF